MLNAGQRNEGLMLWHERDTHKLISEFVANFTASSEDFNAAINQVLRRSGEFMQADRTYVFLLSDDGSYVNNTHEWCRVGIEPEIEHLQNIPTNIAPWLWKQLLDVGYILVPQIDEMPAEAVNEYHILQSQNVRSVCIKPLYMDKKLVGFIGNDAVNEARHWGTEVVDFLTLISDLLGIALVHRKLHQTRELAIRQLERAEQQAHLGHWYLNAPAGTITWSQEMFRIFECEPNQFTPDLETYFEFAHPDDRVALYRAYEQAKASLSELNLEHRILLSGSKIKHLEVKGRFGLAPDGYTLIAEGTTQDVTERIQHRESLQKLAFQDSLTGLPNRRAAQESLIREMEYCESHNRRLVLAFLDLDNFSAINDKHGTALGDSLLKALAQRMRKLFNNTAVIARVGGDEFVILLTRLQPEEGYFQQFNQLLAIISKPLTTNGIEVTLTASIGMTEFPQQIEVTSEQLFRQAQQALFQIKILGKSNLQRFDIGSERDARLLTYHLKKVRQALYNNEFTLYYQPKVYMKTGVVFGVEALIRWQKSTGELIQPGAFLPALYNHPLEVELGDWVIRTALAQMRVWQQQGLTLQVSVNVSSLQLLDSAFVSKLAKDLNDFPDISPAALQLEVLESSALNDLEAVSKVIQLSRKLGVSFALDDFGTGYSSLAYLKHLPVSVLKIDQSFVCEMMENSDDLSIISAVVGMAKAFGLEVIAEGVESVEHGNLLLRLGCDQAQGYGISRPMPAEKVYDWVSHWEGESAWRRQWPVDVHDLPLVYAEVENYRWVMDLEQWLHGKRAEAPVLDHCECKVGLWIQSEKQSRFGLHTKFNHLINLHTELHQVAQHAAAQHSKNNIEVALQSLPEIWRLHDLFLMETRALIS